MKGAIVAAALVLAFIDLVAPCLYGQKQRTTATPWPYPTVPTTSQPPDQSKTPAPPSPVSRSCGHSMYYTNSTSPPGSSIINGVTALPNQYPWLARLRIINGSIIRQCSASIISENWLLTNARCARYASMATDITAIFADWNRDVIDSGEFQIPVESITKHPNYNVPTTNNYDFALLKLQSALDFTKKWTVQAICLPNDCSSGCAVSTKVYIGGWGATFEGSTEGSPFLKSAYVKIADPEDCVQQYASTSTPVTDQMICAGYLGGGVDTCTGDGGGPLMEIDGSYTLCGVTSYGIGCARANAYGVYSKVCSVRTWINTVAGV